MMNVELVNDGPVTIVLVWCMFPRVDRLLPVTLLGRIRRTGNQRAGAPVLMSRRACLQLALDVWYDIFV